MYLRLGTFVLVFFCVTESVVLVFFTSQKVLFCSRQVHSSCHRRCTTRPSWIWNAALKIQDHSTQRTWPGTRTSWRSCSPTRLSISTDWACSKHWEHVAISSRKVHDADGFTFYLSVSLIRSCILAFDVFGCWFVKKYSVQSTKPC